MEPRSLLRDGARKLGVALSDGQLDLFGAYLSELLRWNAKVNLTAITEPREIVIKHFLDSLALCRLLPEGRFQAADIGAGAGFPGLAVKISRPDMELTLIEPSRKKAAFLRAVIRLLGLEGANVLAQKAEEISRAEDITPPSPSYLKRGIEGALPNPTRFDIIFSRAFKEPSALLPIAGPLLKKGGRVVLSLGPGAWGELPAGWRIVSREAITLPFSDYRRTVVALAKV